MSILDYQKRIALAESLIKHLPAEHDGRNTWLINFGTGEEAQQIRAEKGIRWNETGMCGDFSNSERKEDIKPNPSQKKSHLKSTEPLNLDPANIANKIKALMWLSKILDNCPITVTGSTALWFYGMTDQSNPLDLDVIIFGVTNTTKIKLETINEIQEAGDHIYKNLEREEGECIPVNFRFGEGSDEEINIHVFLMPLPKFEPLTYNIASYGLKDKYVSLNPPMQIIKAKQAFARAKDVKDLDLLASRISIVDLSDSTI